MLKKIMLASVLLAIVVAVSYVRMVRSTPDQSWREEIQNETMAEYRTGLDSLRELLESQDDELTEALLQKNTALQARLDSAFARLDSLEAMTTTPSEAPPEELSDGDSAAADSTAEVVVEPEVDSVLQREILSYYESRYEDLPKDLSAYERRVSLYEIRLETARKYDMSLVDLKELRQDYGLRY